MFRIQIIFFFLFLFLLSSCIKEKFDPAKFDLSQKLEPGLAVPVGFSKIGMEKYLADAIANNQLHVADDSLLSLIYSDSVSSGTLGDLLSFPPLGISKDIINETGQAINLPAGFSLPVIEFKDSVFIPVSLEQTGARLDRIVLLSGSLEANLGISVLNGTITYEFPGLQKNLLPYKETFEIPGPGLNIDLAGYTIIPELNGGFKCIFSVEVESTSAPIDPDSSIIRIQTDLKDLMFETIFGDLSGFEIPMPPIQLTPGAFTQVVEGEFGFADPKINLFFSNSVGVPAGLFFSQLDAVLRDSSIISLDAMDIPTDTLAPRTINYPSIEKQEKKDTLLINKENSNLPEFFSSNVNLINITPTPRIGPPVGSEVVFIRYDSKIDLKASIEIPIWGRAEFFVLLDTITFDYLSTSLPVPEELEKLIVRLDLVNSFPVTIAPQVYMLDENKVLLDSIITDNQKIEGALDIDKDGRVNPVSREIDITLVDKDTKDNLVKTHYLVTKGKIMTTPPAEDVKFYLSYFLQYKIGLIAQLKINTGK